MNSIYIRSQDRDCIFAFGALNSALEYTEDEDNSGKKKHMICIKNGDNEASRWKIGEYTSKKRCMEVFEEIRKKCGGYASLIGRIQDEKISCCMTVRASNIIDPHIYQMPLYS